MTDAASTGPEAQWRAALADGRFLLQRAVSSGTVFFPPRLAEPGTGDDDIEWIEASGMGLVYSLTLVSPKPPAEPYNVVLVDLDEGARLMSRVDGVAPAREIAAHRQCPAGTKTSKGAPFSSMILARTRWPMRSASGAIPIPVSATVTFTQLAASVPLT